MTETKPDLEKLELKVAHQKTRDAGVDLLGAVAWHAGEPHTDRPECACPVASAFARRLNDSLPDELRTTLLRPFVLRLVGTRIGLEVELKRAQLVADRVLRELAPRALDHAARAVKGVGLDRSSLSEHAGSLRALPAFVVPVTNAARSTADDVAATAADAADADRVSADSVRGGRGAARAAAGARNVLTRARASFRAFARASRPTLEDDTAKKAAEDRIVTADAGALAFAEAAELGGSENAANEWAQAVKLLDELLAIKS